MNHISKNCFLSGSVLYESCVLTHLQDFPEPSRRNYRVIVTHSMSHLYESMIDSYSWLFSHLPWLISNHESYRVSFCFYCILCPVPSLILNPVVYKRRMFSPFLYSSSSRNNLSLKSQVSCLPVSSNIELLSSTLSSWTSLDQNLSPSQWSLSLS